MFDDPGSMVMMTAKPRSTDHPLHRFRASRSLWVSDDLPVIVVTVVAIMARDSLDRVDPRGTPFYMLFPALVIANVFWHYSGDCRRFSG